MRECRNCLFWREKKHLKGLGTCTGIAMFQANQVEGASLLLRVEDVSKMGALKAFQPVLQTRQDFGCMAFKGDDDAAKI